MADLTTYTPPLASGAGAFQASSTPTIDTSSLPQPVPATPPPTPTITSGALTPQTPITIPQPPAPTNTSAINASVPNPPPTIQSIINQNTQPTATQGAQSDLLGKIAQLTGGQSSLTSQQINAENTAGVPGLAKTMNDLGVQLQGLNDQSTLLANNAAPGGLIQNQVQQSAQGTNDTGGGLAPVQADRLRANQIQQAGIAAQSLTVKSAYYAAQGNYNLAKDAADKAAQVAFDGQTQQINYQKALLAQIQPQLDKEQKIQAATLQAQLNDRANQIQIQQENFKTGNALAITAMQNNPNDPTAQFNAQQALKLDPTSPTYLQDVAALVGKYQTNQVQQQLDNQLKKAQIGEAQASTAKSYADTALVRQQLGALNQAPDYSQLPTDQQASLKQSGFTAFNGQVQSLAQQVVTGNLAPGELSKRATGAAPYNTILQAANAYSMATTGKPFDLAIAQRQYNFANQTSTQNTLTYLTSLVGSPDSPGNLDALVTLSNTMPRSNFPALNNVGQWTKLQTGDPQVAAYYSTITEVSDQIAKILQGGGTGSGTSDAKLAQAQALFQKGFSPAQVTAVVGAIKPLLANRGKALIGDNPYLSDYKAKLGYNQAAAGDTHVYNGVTYKVVNGKWTAQ